MKRVLKLMKPIAISTSKYNCWRQQSVHNPAFFNEYIHNKPSNPLLYDKNQLLQAHLEARDGWLNNDGIVLNDHEKQIFSFIKEVQNAYNGQEIYHTIPRVAGGWVRDKILGKNSNDIDIALDNMDGEAYTQYIVKYQEKQGLEVRTVGIIESNPEQSKHLKTATTHIFGLGIDFVNLRSETYTDNSRIPIMKFGTPTEDAKRRDLTINALFYNIINHSIEDYTESGLSDLYHGYVRTPLDPQTTFKDDPLRILRVIRMASRFHFIIDDEITEACHLDEIQQGLLTKVSRERVGKEVSKMLKGPDPVGALACMVELDVISIVFALSGVFKMSKKQSGYVFDKIQHFKASSQDVDLALKKTRQMFYALRHYKSKSQLSPLLATFLSQFPHFANAPHETLPNLIYASWRLSKSVYQETYDILTGAIKLHSLLLSIYEKSDKMNDSDPFSSISSILSDAKSHHRADIGIFIRKYRDHLHEIIMLVPLLSSAPFEVTQTLMSFFNDPSIVSLLKVRPLINGRDASLLFKLKGKAIGELLDRALYLQLERHPISKDELIELLKRS